MSQLSTQKMLYFLSKQRKWRIIINFQPRDKNILTRLTFLSQRMSQLSYKFKLYYVNFKKNKDVMELYSMLIDKKDMYIKCFYHKKSIECYLYIVITNYLFICTYYILKYSSLYITLRDFYNWGCGPFLCICLKPSHIVLLVTRYNTESLVFISIF